MLPRRPGSTASADGTNSIAIPTRGTVAPPAEGRVYAFPTVVAAGVGTPSIATREPRREVGVQGRSRRTGTLRVPRAAVGAYLAGRLWQLLFLGPPIETADTSMYRYAGQRWLGFSAGNFTGRTLRAWPITLLYSAAPTDTSRIVSQFALATCCWAFCIWQFGRVTSQRAVAALAAGAVVLLALSR